MLSEYTARWPMYKVSLSQFPTESNTWVHNPFPEHYDSSFLLLTLRVKTSMLFFFPEHLINICHMKQSESVS